MFSKIMVPVDLAHKGALGRALDCAADLAQRHGAQVTYLGVTAAMPSAVAHSPAEFGKKLDAFAAEQGQAHGIEVASLVAESHDPAVDMDRTILRAVDKIRPDLIVMQSHKPGLADYLFEGHGPFLAQHSKTSVMLVRDQ